MKKSLIYLISCILLVSSNVDSSGNGQKDMDDKLDEKERRKSSISPKTDPSDSCRHPYVSGDNYTYLGVDKKRDVVLWGSKTKEGFLERLRKILPR